MKTLDEIIKSDFSKFAKISNDMSEQVGELAVRIADCMEKLCVKSISGEDVKIERVGNYYAYPKYQFCGFTETFEGNPAVYILAFNEEGQWKSFQDWVDDDMFYLFKADTSKQYIFLTNVQKMFEKLKSRANDIENLIKKSKV